jgi:enterochelin esterase family protein
MRRFAQDMTQNVIPYVDKTYRTIANRDNRAIGGFSRGGGQTLRTAFWNTDKFSWICAYSANLPSNEMESAYSSIVSNHEKTNKELKLLWVGVGTEDFLYNDVSTFLNYLNSKKINYKSLITGGGHTWMNVKTYFTETSQLLFK